VSDDKTAWAIEQLRAFVHGAELVGVSGLVGMTQPRAGYNEVSKLADTAELVMDRVVPEWRQAHGYEKRTSSWVFHREWANRAINRLERADELAAYAGDGSPTMSAGGLHPWVWDGVRSLWQTGHYRAALATAGSLVNINTQAKVGRTDIVETDLMKQAFSLGDPAPGANRLRRMEDDQSKTYANLHRGAWCLAEGLYAGIRNVSAHGVEEPTEQVALEQLAAWSVLARWVDDAKVVTAA